MKICKHNQLLNECDKCYERMQKGREKKITKGVSSNFSNKQRQIYLDMKEKEKLLNSISPKLIDYRERLKKEISELQKKINELDN